MLITFLRSRVALLAFAVGLCSLSIHGQSSQGQNSQTQPPQQPAKTSQTAGKQPKHSSPGGEAGRGAGDIGKGTAKGAGAAAKGVGKGAADLVTLHPIDAASSVGKGAGAAGKDVGVGAVKGTGKIAKGAGRGIGKIFHHSHKKAHTAPDTSEPQH